MKETRRFMAGIVLSKRLVKLLFDLAVRFPAPVQGYDRLILLRVAALIYPLVNVWKKRRLPEFVERTARAFRSFSNRFHFPGRIG